MHRNWLTRSLVSAGALAVLGLVLEFAPLAFAQPPDNPPGPPNPPGAPAAQPQQPNVNPALAQIRAISKAGPLKAALGHVAQIDVPAGYRFIEAHNMRRFGELTQNPADDKELGALMPEAFDWFIVFDFSDIGYVKDDEKDKLDANAILQSIRQGNEQGNAERRKRGWATMEIMGWRQTPFYDPQTNNLTWAIEGRSEGHMIVNYNCRLLGRGGVMSANLVVDPDELHQTLPTYKKLLAGFSYQPGHKYSEYRSGDKVAAYGLAALVGGGALVVAAKSGWLGKLIKPLIVGAVALAGAIAALFRRLFRGRSAETQDG